MPFNATLPDIPRVFTAVAEWLACIICMVPYIRKWEQSIFVKSIIFLVGQLILQILVSNWPLEFWIIGMAMNIIWMVIFLKSVLSINNILLILLVVKAVIISELFASLAWQMITALISDHLLTQTVLLYIMMILFYAIFTTLLLIIDLRINYRRLYDINSTKITTVVIFIGILVFLVSNVGFLLINTPYHFGNSNAVFFIRTIVDLLGLTLIYLYIFLLIDHHRKDELSNVRSLFQSQYQQYKSFIENTQYINRKAHDLKHQIQLLLKEDDLHIRNQYIEDLNQSIESLNHKIETGNGVLDALLTRKNIYCSNHDIQLSCIADGSLLNHMELMDTVSLIGNALDNAIEHVEKLDKEKRLIQLKLMKKGAMVVFRVENYCMQEPEFIGKLPKTSKVNTQDHGYGLKNIKYITKKYDGEMTILYENNWFYLTVILPAFS